MKKTDFEIGEEIELWNFGKWKVIGIDEDRIHLESVTYGEDWTWSIANRKTHPQYKMLIKAKEGKSMEQAQKEIREERNNE